MSLFITFVNIVFIRYFSCFNKTIILASIAGALWLHRAVIYLCLFSLTKRSIAFLVSALISLMKMPRFKGKFISKRAKGPLHNLCRGKKGEKLLTYGLESVQDCDDKQPPAENSYEKEQMERPDEIVETQTQNDSCDLSSTVEGRRVIDVAFMASQMTCIACSHQLHLMDIVKETRYGLASLFRLICSRSSCRHLNTVSTSRRHGGRSGPYVVNSKSVLGK